MGGCALSASDLLRRRARWLNAVLMGVIAGAGLVLLVLTYRAVEAERVERAQVQRTLAVLDNLRAVGMAVLNAETGQRGYLLTLDRRYLEPFVAGRERIGPALDRLASVNPADITPRQQELLDEIDALSRAKFSEMEQSVALVASGQMIEARRQVLSDEGQETMERLRRAIRDLELLEAAELSAAANTAEASEGLVLPFLGALLILLLLAVVGGGRLLARTAHAEAEAAQAAALAEARDRADLLARELNHRVKNLFSVILAIIQMSARNQPEAAPVIARIVERVHALLTAHQVTQGDLHNPMADLRELIETTLAPYRSANLECAVDGPHVDLPARRVTPLGLVLHELTTNAVKYGAWANGGTLTVGWRVEDGGEIALDWHENGLTIDHEPATKGFGTLLMTSAARQLGGTIERRFTPGEMHVAIRFPGS